ncbi:hypothetical protein D3C84_576190 [compost metagenome]
MATKGDIQAETVEQLWTQFTLFGIHGANQHELRRVPMGNAVTLNQIGAAGGHIEQQVNEVIRQQIDLVDVEHTTVSLGQHAGRELGATFPQRRVEIEGADQALFGGAQRQCDELPAGQQVRQTTGQGRLGHAARSFDQDPADFRVDGGQVQGQFQIVGADHGGEREMRGVGHCSISVMVGDLTGASILVGASLLAMAFVQSKKMLPDRPLSRASSLPQVQACQLSSSISSNRFSNASR